MRRFITLAILALALSSCASLEPYSFHYRELTDSSRVLKKTSGESTLVVRREPAFTGGGADHFFILDGDKVVQLDQEEQFTLHIAPGQYVIGSLCELPPFPSHQHETALTAQPGKTYFYRLFSSTNDICQIAPMSR